MPGRTNCRRGPRFIQFPMAAQPALRRAWQRATPMLQVITRCWPTRLTPPSAPRRLPKWRQTTRMLPRKWSWPVLRLPHRQNRSSSCRARPCGNLIANALGRCGLDRKPHRPAEKCRQLSSQHPLPQPKSIRLPKCACNRSSRRILTRTQIASANRIFRRSRSPFPRISFSFPAKWLPLAVCGRAASRVRWRR